MLLPESLEQENNVLIIDKPLGWTSFDVVKVITRKYKYKAGHAGTLDPMATGVLLVCTGKKTKEIEQLQALPKTYTGSMVLGAFKASFDTETAVTEVQDISVLNLTGELLQTQADNLTGELQQVAPLFSAKKINGTPVYEIARAGREAELKANTVTVYSFKISNFRLRDLSAQELNGINIAQFKKHLKEQPLNPLCELGINSHRVAEMDFEITCSKGTYIRSLARDLALSVGCQGYLSRLTRTAIGDYSLLNAHQLV